MPLDKILLTIFKVFSFVAGILLGYVVFDLSSFWNQLEDALKSVIFQGALILLALYVTSSSSNIFVSTFLLSALARSLYVQYRDYKRGNLKSWFDSLNKLPSQNFMLGYFVVITIVFVYSLMNFVF